MLDISFNNGGQITITSGGKTTRIIAFPADEDPITVDDVEATGHQYSLNGELLGWRKPISYIVRVSVYANSSNDETLASILSDTKYDTGVKNLKDLDDVTVKMTVVTCKTRNGNKKQSSAKDNGSKELVRYEFGDGFIVGGSPAVSVDSEGRVKAKRYSFVFGSMKIT